MGRQGICVDPLDGVTEHCGEWSVLRLSGKFLDPPYKNKCSEFEADLVGVQYQSISDSGDAIVVERKGIKPGYGFEEKEEFVQRGETVFSHYVVDGISHGNLDPGLFAKPDTKLIRKSRNQEKERPTDKNQG